MSELLRERAEYCDTSQHMPHNIQEEQRHQPCGSGSLKSCMGDNIEKRWRYRAFTKDGLNRYTEMGSVLIYKGKRHMGQPKTRWLNLVSKTWRRELRGDKKLRRNVCGRDWRLFTEPVWCGSDEKRKQQKLLSKMKAKHFSCCFL